MENGDDEEVDVGQSLKLQNEGFCVWCGVLGRKVYQRYLEVRTKFD